MNQVDLVGGYYDAGDNIKFGLPMAFTTTMLAWSVLEFFGRKKMMMMLEEERLMAHEAVRWATDYLLKASAHLPQALYVQVTNSGSLYCRSRFRSRQKQSIRVRSKNRNKNGTDLL